MKLSECGVIVLPWFGFSDLEVTGLHYFEKYGEVTSVDGTTALAEFIGTHDNAEVEVIRMAISPIEVRVIIFTDKGDGIAIVFKRTKDYTQLVYSSLLTLCRLADVEFVFNDVEAYIGLDNNFKRWQACIREDASYELLHLKYGSDRHA